VIKFNEGAHKEHYLRIIKDSNEMDNIDRAYKFGVASVVASIVKWCEECEEKNIIPTNDEIKTTFLDWVSYDVEGNMIFNDILDKLSV